MLKAIGLLFVLLAAIGVVLPLLPTTPFLLVAAWCFAKSSPRLNQKLLSNKIFGPLIINWQKSRSITKRAKFISLGSMVIACGYSCYLLQPMYLKILTVVLIAWPFIFVARLPVTEQ